MASRETKGGIVLAENDGAGLATLTGDDLERVAEALDASWSSRTKKAYGASWRVWVAWCEGRGYRPLPADPAALAAYLAERAEAGRAIATLQLDLAAIAQAHEVAGHPKPQSAPEVSKAWKGLRRLYGRPQRRVAPLEARHVALMMSACPTDTPAGIRDRALLGIGYAGAFRRSELAALEVRDVEQVPGEGLRVMVRRSKTDQEGTGIVKCIAFGRSADTCPVRALASWFEAAGLEEGPIFRSVDQWGNVAEEAITGRSVARIIKAIAGRVGIAPERVSGHSLRAGFVTTALEAGVDALTVARTTGHKSVNTIAVYDRRRDVWTPSGL